MKTGQQLPFKQEVDLPWGHPSLTVAVLAVTEAPVPAEVQDYLERVPPRARTVAVTAKGGGSPALVLTDGFAEVFSIWSGGPESWPEPSELSEWIDWVATQCPECSPVDPAWRDALR